ncbi:MAG: hypothetical protein J5701_08185 [Bacteroidales bacterium]|nr:hypothetical protein [Bacteroidales bacterium]
MIAACFSAYGQESAAKKTKTIIIENDTNIIDNNSLVWGSVNISGIESYEYSIDYLQALLIVRNPAIKGRSVRIEYRTYPYLFGKKEQKLPISDIESNIYAPISSFDKESNMSGSFNEVFSDAMLNSSGSLSRGISLGNTQDMIVNSNLNLQLSGKLSEDVEILANITDENIPVQPDGNTAQLQEFDKVFIQLKYKNTATVLAGDIEKTVSDNYFMKFSKKGQGLMADTRFLSNTRKGDTIHYGVNFMGAVAKGIYVKQTIVAIESNQGPYKLQGKSNETYITVLAGSERVYIDEQLLTRGEENDYVINYNSGEITFTARCPITVNKRIIVEFEYVNQDYLKSTMHLNTSVEGKKWKVGFNFFNHQDHKNQPNAIDLTDAQKWMLSQMKSGSGDVYVLNMTRAEPNTNEVLYTLVDTMVNGILYDSVFVYNPAGDSNVYRLGFMLVGAHQGDYVLQEGTVNGRVYVWVAPQNGVPQGNYAPLQRLATPQREQMYSLGVEYKVHPTTTLSVNTALSNNDNNTFSRYDNADNVGAAVQLKMDNCTPLKYKTKPLLWKMMLNAAYEFKNNHFKYIEDYRDLDFKRNYNVSDSFARKTDHYAGMNINFVHPSGQIGVSSFAYIIPEERYIADKSALWAQFLWKGYHVNVQASFMNHKQAGFNSNYIKHGEILEKACKKIVAGVKNDMEVNIYRELNGVLMRESFAFNEITGYLRNGDSLKKVDFGLYYTNRIDAAERNGALATNRIAHQAKADVKMLPVKGQQLNAVISYRNVHVRDSIGENTLLSSIDYQGRWCKGAVQLGLFYEVGSGMEQKNEYTYLKVAAGQGVYQWIDYNGNGVEELDEFEIAKYKDEADYIRLWRSSDTYVKTFNNQFVGSLVLRPSVVWRNQSGWKKFLARFANTCTYRSLYKNTLADIAGMFNPFYINDNDTNVVTASSTFRNVFSFNQISQIWGMDVIYHDYQVKSLTVNGFESSDIYSCSVSERLNIKQMFTLNASYENGWNIRRSDYMSKNYKIDCNKVNAMLVYQYKNSFKMSVSYSYADKANNKGEETSVSHTAGIEADYRILHRGNIMLKANYCNIKFKGNTNTSAAYEMLEALQPGHNMILDAVFQITLWQNMQLNATYQGRISEGVKMKHVAGVEIRAFF